jgi:hypothetical protein
LSSRVDWLVDEKFTIIEEVIFRNYFFVN